jgi:LPS-assembly lipoprotein
MIQSAPRFAIAALAGLMLAGCTVQPLYAPSPKAETVRSVALGSVYIEPVNERPGQEVRNALIFLMNGGAKQPADPAYTLALDVTSITESALIVQLSARDGEPTSSNVVVAATYKLTRSADGTEIGSRRASATASYDISQQEFANTRAERDAEKRAARETAEQLRALIAADLSRAGAL